jgi:hypothetical protein
MNNKRMLIISNNVLSRTKNNGKTILSYIDSLENVDIAQLYFSEEKPEIKKYKYFKLSDIDILKGFLKSSFRGTIPQLKKEGIPINERKYIKKSDCTMIIRELMWLVRWQSRQLNEWLDDFSPNIIFFVAGDCVFSYRIANYIQNKYKCRFTLYVTDDYILPRKNEGILHSFRRWLITDNLKKTLRKATNFYTISKEMEIAYEGYLGRKSYLAVNMTESMKRDDVQEEKEYYYLIYTGSLYYGRDMVLRKIAEAISLYNKNNNKKAYLKIYSNSVPDDVHKFEIKGASRFCGMLNKDDIIMELNKSNIPVFVESFDSNMIAKTKYSLSTKVPEYLSLGKAVLAVGPKGIGSMNYLSDKACCVNSLSDIYVTLDALLNSDNLINEYGKIAKDAYERNHNKESLQNEFKKNVLG